VKAAPSEVTLKFNERLEPSFSSAISRSSPCLLAFCATVQAAKDGPADLCSRAVSLAGGNWMFRPAQAYYRPAPPKKDEPKFTSTSTLEPLQMGRVIFVKDQASLQHLVVCDPHQKVW